MTLLGKDAILAAQDLGHEDVEVPEWGGAVRVRMMSGADRDAWETSFASPEMFRRFQAEGAAAIAENIRARLVCFTVVDEDGKRLFTPADIVALSAKSAAALDRVFAVAQRLNGLTEGDIRDLGKVYAAIFGGASTSSSPAT